MTDSSLVQECVGLQRYLLRLLGILYRSSRGLWGRHTGYIRQALEGFLPQPNSLRRFKGPPPCAVRAAHLG